MYNKKLVLIPLMVFVLAGMCFAAGTWVAPTNTDRIYGTYGFNVTVTMAELENCTVTGTSASSGDTLTEVLVNDTQDGNWAIANIDTTTYEDAADWSLIATCYNNSGGTETAAAITVIFDNTAPDAPSSITPTTSDDKNSIPLSATVVGANTTSCTYTATSSFHTETGDMTHTGDTCSLTIDLPGSGDYQLTITATDGTNSSSTTQSLKVNELSGGIVNKPNNTSSEGPLSKTAIVVILGIVVLVLMRKK